MQSYEASHACCPVRACQQRQRPKSASRRAHGRDVRAERANRAGPGGERRAPERRLVPVSSLMNMQPNSKIEGISRAISSGKLSPRSKIASPYTNPVQRWPKMRTKIDHPGSLLAPPGPLLFLAVINPRFQLVQKSFQNRGPKTHRPPRLSENPHPHNFHPPV